MVRGGKLVCMLLRLALFALLTRLFSLAGVRVGHILGSRTSFFAGGSVMTPLAGLFGSVFECGVLSAINAALVIWRWGVPVGRVSTYGIPSFFAALYWSTPSFWTRFAVPVICMLLFYFHPVGGEAFAYTLYWLIPMAFYVFRLDNLIFNALGSTFVQHAVGSVIWLYTVPMSAQAWLSLIPVVARERLLIAAWMVCVYLVAQLGYRVWCYLARYLPCIPYLQHPSRGA